MRVRNLIAIYDHARRALPLRRDAPPSDVLRSAVVLLHAVLEESVRRVAMRLLPHVGDEALNGIPLSTTDRSLRFGLAALAQYRGQSVDDVLKHAVEAHLLRQTFNSTIDLSGILLQCGVSVDRLRPIYPAPQTVMERRHRIVHEGDYRNKGRWQGQPDPLSRRQVIVWTRAVEGFVGELHRAISGKRVRRKRPTTK